MEDKKISEAVELLYKGAKMLSYYCPECKVPLFKDKDRIFCPSCKRDVIFESDIKSGAKINKALPENLQIKEAKPVEHQKPLKPQKLQESQESQTYQDARPELEKIFKDAISNLALKLENIEDTQNLKEIVELIEKLTNLIEKLKRLKYI